jgi:type II secretory pathway predicted ATPase ExeA
MYRQHFGLSAHPFDKAATDLWEDGAMNPLRERFNWLLQSPGLGLLYGEPGVGKTSAIRKLSQSINPHRYQVIYTSETDFGRTDLYRSLGMHFGLEPHYRRANMWRDLKEAIQEKAETQNCLPVWILDEAQNLPPSFFRDFPSFLNFAFDSKDLMTVWMVGLPPLAQTIDRAINAPLASRIQMRAQIKPLHERDRFQAFLQHGLKVAGCEHTLMTDTGIEQLRQASQGIPRQVGRIVRQAMRLAVPKGLNHIPDDLIQQAIEELR